MLTNYYRKCFNNIELFFTIKSFFVYFVLFISILPNVFHLNKLTFNNKFIFFVNYIFIPSVLLVSVSDINFNYDVGISFKSSKLAQRIKDNFWNDEYFLPFGMSSIYEYISKENGLKKV